MGLTPEQVDIIKATVPVVKEHGNTITSLFYKTLLTENPELNNVFNTVHQLTGHQATALAGSLYAYAANIDNIGALTPLVERVCMKHASLYIRREQYDVVGRYLLAAMGDVLGPALTPEIHGAWSAAYNQLADLMANREDDLMSASHGWTEWRDFRIIEKVPETEEITSFYLSPVDGQPLPSYRPGQYISVQLDVPALKYLQARQYSLSDRPRQDYYRISVKKERGLSIDDPAAVRNPGYISNILHDVKKEGDTVRVSHPQGDFYLTNEKASTPLVLISAGVGITPLTSITNTLLTSPTSYSGSSSSTSSGRSPTSETTSSSQGFDANSSSRRIHHLHTLRTPSHLPFNSHLQSLSRGHREYTLSLFLTNPTSSSKSTTATLNTFSERLTPATLKSQLENQPDGLFKSLKQDLENPETEYYICGPENFMHGFRKGLIEEFGVRGEKVKMELFGTGGTDLAES